ncbi:MAG TPA: AAA family ATPase, partial [Chthoniobacterales bacterium]|nr:AAA family ATPase [Chthoniobacterales bacterium]
MAFTRDSALEFLRRAEGQNRLAHAYLISGPIGSGKRSLAAEITSAVNGTKASDVFSTAAREVFVAEPESKSRRIVVEQIRNLEHSLQMRASAPGRRKVAIIAEADRLQPQAANAFLKTLEEPPENSLLLLLSALPEALPDTILSRCIPIPLAGVNVEPAEQQDEFVELLRAAANEKTWSVQHAYGLAQGLQRLLGGIRDEIKEENAEALKQEETRYKNSTDGAWLEDREDYYKALTESQYLQRRAGLIETLFVWWSDVLRAKTGVDRRDLASAKKEITALASRLSTAEVLRRIRHLEEMRNNLGRNIQEALAIEV